MKELKLCWNILPKVSRSFALCIKILPRPLNDQMMLSYLIFRIIDTIEDSSAPLEVKRQLFDDFMGVLRARKFDAAKAKACTKGLCSKLDCTYEKELMANAEAVVRLYHSLPKGVRAPICKRAKAMVGGMYEFQKKGIETFADQNRYSHYVAGVIGYLFNDLLHFNKIITRQLKRRLHRYARQFGLALQKVNILRDIAQDIRANRHYWPRALLAKYGLSYDNLCSEENRKAAMKILRAQIKNAQNYLVAAMKYVLLLPKNALQVRMFCLIPLFMAIESYVKCAENCDVFDIAKTVKINRGQVEEIVAKSGLWGTSNERLLKWFMDSMARASPEFLNAEYASVFPYSAED